jgi:hypothetical protein
MSQKDNNRLYESNGVRKAGWIRLSGCQPNRVHSSLPFTKPALNGDLYHRWLQFVDRSLIAAKLTPYFKCEPSVTADEYQVALPRGIEPLFQP